MNKKNIFLSFILSGLFIGLPLHAEVTGFTKSYGSHKAEKEVTIYVTSWCPYCVKLEKFLNKKKISYQKYDIEKDASGRVKYNRLGKRGIPITTVGDQVISGFDPETILTALK